MTQTIPETEPTERKEFHITTEEAANWYLRKQANIEAEKQRVKAQAEAIVKRLESDAESLRHLYEAELQEYVRQKLSESGNRRKSVHFLQGTCAYRTVPARLKMDEDYEGEYPAEFYETTPVFQRAAYLCHAEERLQQCGELLPGVEVEPERETFSIRFGKQEA